MLKPGTTLGKYKLNALMGGGGYSEVYSATHIGAAGFSREVAVKVLRPALQKRPEISGLFAREARNAAQLHHRNIVQVFEFSCDQSTFFMAMELVRGTTARELTLMGGTVPLWVGVSIGLEVACALQHAHELTDSKQRAVGLIHRDIKPANILLSDQGDVKLSDFGLSKMTLVDTDHLTRIGVVRGTLAYMSPEQKSGDSATIASDIYSLGRVVYELCAGINEGHPLGVKRGQDLPPLSSIRDQIPVALDQALRESLSIHPSDRPTALQLGQVFQQTLTELLPADKLSRLSVERAHWVELCKAKHLQLKKISALLPMVAAPEEESVTAESLLGEQPTANIPLKEALFAENPEVTPTVNDSFHDLDSEETIRASLSIPEEEESSIPTAVGAPPVAAPGDASEDTPVDPSVEGLDSEDILAAENTSDTPVDGVDVDGVDVDGVDVVELLRAAQHSEVTSVPPEEISRPDVKMPSKRRLAPLRLVRILLVALLVVIAAAIGFYSAQLPDSTADDDAGAALADSSQRQPATTNSPSLPTLNSTKGTGPDLTVATDTAAPDTKPPRARVRKNLLQRARGPARPIPSQIPGGEVKLREKPAAKLHEKPAAKARKKPAAKLREKPAAKTRRKRPRPQAATKLEGQGLLSVNSAPWSKVFLDGRLVGTTPIYRQKIPAGPHRLELRAQSGGTWRKHVTILPDKHKNLGLIQLR